MAARKMAMEEKGSDFKYVIEDDEKMRDMNYRFRAALENLKSEEEDLPDPESEKILDPESEKVPSKENHQEAETAATMDGEIISAPSEIIESEFTTDPEKLIELDNGILLEFVESADIPPPPPPLMDSMAFDEKDDRGEVKLGDGAVDEEKKFDEVSLIVNKVLEEVSYDPISLLVYL